MNITASDTPDVLTSDEYEGRPNHPIPLKIEKRYFPSFARTCRVDAFSCQTEGSGPIVVRLAKTEQIMQRMEIFFFAKDKFVQQQITL